MILGPVILMGLGVGVGLFAGYKAETFVRSAKYGGAAVLGVTGALFVLLFLLSAVVRLVTGGLDGLADFLAPVATVGSLVTFATFVLYVGVTGVCAGIVGGVIYRLRNRNDGYDLGDGDGDGDRAAGRSG